MLRLVDEAAMGSCNVVKVASICEGIVVVVDYYGCYKRLPEEGGGGWFGFYRLFDILSVLWVYSILVYNY